MTTLNADPQELAKFSDLAHRWWDTQSEFRPLHEINPLRLGWIEQHTRLAAKRVVDIGCGGGILSDAMARRGADVLGIDLAGKALKVAQLHAMEAGTPSIEYREVAAEVLAAEQPAQFDIVTCMEMLEHVPRPAAMTATLARALRPGGALFVSTINRNLRSFLLAIVGAEYLLGLIPRGTHEYERLILPSELARWARAAGLTLQSLAGIELNPFTGGVALGRDVAVNYLAHFQR